MDKFANFGNPYVIAGWLLALIVAGFVIARIMRARSAAAASRLPETPTEAEAEFLDSSHIISGPLTGRTPDAHPRTAPGEPPPDAAAHRDTP